MPASAGHTTPRPALIVLASATGDVESFAQGVAFDEAWFILDGLVAADASAPALWPEGVSSLARPSVTPTSTAQIEEYAKQNLEAGIRLQFHYEPGAWIEFPSDATYRLKGFGEVSKELGAPYRASGGGTSYHVRLVDMGFVPGEPMTSYGMIIESSHPKPDGSVATGWVVRSSDGDFESDLADLHKNQ